MRVLSKHNFTLTLSLSRISATFARVLKQLSRILHSKAGCVKYECWKKFNKKDANVLYLRDCSLFPQVHWRSCITCI